MSISLNETLELLKETPIFFSRLGFSYDPPIKDENGNPIVFSSDYKKYADYHKDIKNTGVKLHTFILHTGWVGVDEYDYSVCDKTLKHFFDSCGDDAYIIPRIKLNVPPSWTTANPEDTFVYFNGPRTKEEIRSLCETKYQDWLGYPAEFGYYQAGEFTDTRPNKDSFIGLQSFSSEKWRRDAGNALEKLLEHLEQGEYADRILGYHIAYGRCGETIMFGEGNRGDYGINQLRNFYDFALNKYKSKEVLNEKWGYEVSRDNVLLPSQQKRYDDYTNILEFHRSDESDIICSDYDEFLSFSNAESLEYFAKIIKERTGKAVGAFYGYYMYNSFAQYCGHCALDKVLDSPYIDFMASPVSYYRRDIGDGGGEMLPIQSIGKKKLWISEIDIRSYLCKNDIICSCDTYEKTKAVFWREVARTFSSNCGFWLMDLGGGWYDSEKMHTLAKEINDIACNVNKQEHKSCSDVLFLTSEKGLMHSKISEEILNTVKDLHTDARRMGFWYDSYRVSDLKSLDISKYKLTVISYAFALDDEDISLIFDKIKTPVVFFGSVGIIKNGKTAIENINSLTGINVNYNNMQLYVDDENAVPLKKENGVTVIAEKQIKDRKHIVCFAKHFPELRDLAIECGCKIHAPAGVTSCGDNRFSAFFAADKKVEIEKDKDKTVVSGCAGNKLDEYGYRVEIVKKA